MKKIQRVLICLLVACMILPFLASCNKKNQSGDYKKPPAEENQQNNPSGGGDGGNSGNSGNSGNGGNGNGGNDGPIGGEEPEDPDAGIVMPEIVDMEGYTYRAYVRIHAGDTLEEQLQHGNNRYACIDFWIDEANSENDIISYAVYSRNNRIEADYNCKIRQVASNGSQIAHLTDAYINGEGYDLTIISAKPAAQAATQNLLRDLNSMEFIDLTHDAYDPNAVTELSFEDKLYYVSGDMNISTLEVAGLSLVNMDFYADVAESIVETFDGDTAYADIYSLVTSKKWTMNTLMTIAELANVDVDETDGPDLSVVDKGDKIGYHQYFNSTIWYFYSSGGRITTKGDSGIPELTIHTPKNQEIANYIYDHFNHVISVPWIPHGMSSLLNDNFLTGDVLFMDCALFEVRMEIYPRAEFEYGILPCPIYEEGQDYHSLVYFNNWAHLWAIPSRTVDLEKAQRMMQIMTVYSSLHESTMYAYYDRTIYLNAAPDNGSRGVIDMIRRSMVYDIALMYNWGGLEDMLDNIATANSNPYGPAVNGIEARVNPLIEETVWLLRAAASATQ